MWTMCPERFRRKPANGLPGARCGRVTLAAAPGRREGPQAGSLRALRPRESPGAPPVALRALPGRQRGLSIMVALFILVVLAFLGVALVTISGVEHREPVLALQGKRAFWAAQSGLQWAGHEALHDSGFNCPAQPTATPSSYDLPSSRPGLDGFSVTLTCTRTTHKERGKTVTIYDITATARNGTYGQAAFAQRRYRTIVGHAG